MKTSEFHQPGVDNRETETNHHNESPTFDEKRENWKTRKNMKIMRGLGSHRGNDIHLFGRRNLIAPDSLPTVRSQSITSKCEYSVLSFSSFIKKIFFKLDTGGISKVTVASSKAWLWKKKKSNRRKAGAKGFFQKEKNNGTYHQTLQSMRESDTIDHFSIWLHK